ncbi:hypothetical protein Btru_073678 [Bulinus truncatus]|nr:hypothetical protein Btru_073678 [Bulinus truncatus]
MRVPSSYIVFTCDMRVSSSYSVFTFDMRVSSSYSVFTHDMRVSSSYIVFTFDMRVSSSYSVFTFDMRVSSSYSVFTFDMRVSSSYSVFTFDMRISSHEMNLLTAIMNLLNRLTEDVQTLPFVLAILLNLVLNLCLIGQIVKRKHFYTSPKYTVMLTMAVADILQAELPFVIACKKTLLREGEELTDLEKLIAKFYIHHFVHFVYGYSLALLGAELVCRQLIEGLARKRLVAGITGCIPWAAGMLAVFLLVVTDQNYGYFTSQSSLNLTSAVCVFQPATLALIMCAGICVTHFWASDKDYMPMPDSSYLAVLKDISDTIISGMGLNNPKNVPSYQHKVAIDSSVANFATKSSAQRSSPVAHAQNLESSTQQQQNELSMVSTTDPDHHRHAIQRDLTLIIRQSFRKEIYQLLAITFVYTVTVLPYHLFSLVGTMDHDTMQYEQTVNVLRWIMFFRSCITPFITLRFSTQYKFVYARSIEMTITTFL